MDIKKTANLFANFTIKRIAEIFGIAVFCSGVLLLLALLTYSPEDPNFIFPENTKIENILGFHGSFISDIFLQSIGLVSYLFSITLIVTGINTIRGKEIFLIIENIFFAIIYSLLGTLFFAFILSFYERQILLNKIFYFFLRDIFTDYFTFISIIFSFFFCKKFI